ncbi:MAG: SMC-Scp complex subunit ScpB [Candidatus Omnitrophica bacterium]|nr:SMC-Scp complex subunit ScpB [Candidatus Omnitrophota bacterium]
MDSDKLKNIIEALLIVSEHGLCIEEIKKAVTDTDRKDIENTISLLKSEYQGSRRAFNIAEIAGRYRIVSKPEYMPWISNLYQKEPTRLTGATLETLAIIAYKQPATRAEIESVRGVNVGGVLRTLLDKDLIEVRGRKDVIGKPLIYGTTDKFLELFGLNSLGDLPALREFTEDDLEYGKGEAPVPVDNEEKEEENTPEETRVTVGNEEGAEEAPLPRGASGGSDPEDGTERENARAGGSDKAGSTEEPEYEEEKPE